MDSHLGIFLPNEKLTADQVSICVPVNNTPFAITSGQHAHGCTLTLWSKLSSIAPQNSGISILPKDNPVFGGNKPRFLNPFRITRVHQAQIIHVELGTTEGGDIAAYSLDKSGVLALCIYGGSGGIKTTKIEGALDFIIFDNSIIFRSHTELIVVNAATLARECVFDLPDNGNGDVAWWGKVGGYLLIVSRIWEGTREFPSKCKETLIEFTQDVNARLRYICTTWVCGASHVEQLDNETLVFLTKSCTDTFLIPPAEVEEGEANEEAKPSPSSPPPNLTVRKNKCNIDWGTGKMPPQFANTICVVRVAFGTLQRSHTILVEKSLPPHLRVETLSVGGKINTWKDTCLLMSVRMTIDKDPDFVAVHALSLSALADDLLLPSASTSSCVSATQTPSRDTNSTAAFTLPLPPVTLIGFGRFATKSCNCLILNRESRVARRFKGDVFVSGTKRLCLIESSRQLSDGQRLPDFGLIKLEDKGMDATESVSFLARRAALHMVHALLRQQKAKEAVSGLKCNGGALRSYIPALILPPPVGCFVTQAPTGSDGPLRLITSSGVEPVLPNPLQPIVVGLGLEAETRVAALLYAAFGKRLVRWDHPGEGKLPSCKVRHEVRGLLLEALQRYVVRHYRDTPESSSPITSLAEACGGAFLMAGYASGVLEVYSRGGRFHLRQHPLFARFAKPLPHSLVLKMRVFGGDIIGLCPLIRAGSTRGDDALSEAEFLNPEALLEGERVVVSDGGGMGKRERGKGAMCYLSSILVTSSKIVKEVCVEREPASWEDIFNEVAKIIDFELAPSIGLGEPGECDEVDTLGLEETVVFSQALARIPEPPAKLIVTCIRSFAIPHEHRAVAAISDHSTRETIVLARSTKQLMSAQQHLYCLHYAWTDGNLLGTYFPALTANPSDTSDPAVQTQTCRDEATFLFQNGIAANNTWVDNCLETSVPTTLDGVEQEASSILVGTSDDQTAFQLKLIEHQQSICDTFSAGGTRGFCDVALTVKANIRQIAYDPSVPKTSLTSECGLQAAATFSGFMQSFAISLTELRLRQKTDSLPYFALRQHLTVCYLHYLSCLLASSPRFESRALVSIGESQGVTFNAEAFINHLDSLSDSEERTVLTAESAWAYTSDVGSLKPPTSRGSSGALRLIRTAREMIEFVKDYTTGQLKQPVAKIDINLFRDHVSRSLGIPTANNELPSPIRNSWRNIGTDNKVVRGLDPVCEPLMLVHLDTIFFGLPLIGGGLTAKYSEVRAHVLSQCGLEGGIGGTGLSGSERKGLKVGLAYSTHSDIFPGLSEFTSTKVVASETGTTESYINEMADILQTLPVRLLTDILLLCLSVGLILQRRDALGDFGSLLIEVVQRVPGELVKRSCTNGIKHGVFHAYWAGSLPTVFSRALSKGPIISQASQILFSRTSNALQEVRFTLEPSVGVLVGLFKATRNILLDGIIRYASKLQARGSNYTPNPLRLANQAEPELESWDGIAVAVQSTLDAAETIITAPMSATPRASYVLNHALSLLLLADVVVNSDWMTALIRTALAVLHRFVRETKNVDDNNELKSSLSAVHRVLLHARPFVEKGNAIEAYSILLLDISTHPCAKREVSHSCTTTILDIAQSHIEQVENIICSSLKSDERPLQAIVRLLNVLIMTLDVEKASQLASKTLSKLVSVSGGGTSGANAVGDGRGDEMKGRKELESETTLDMSQLYPIPLSPLVDSLQSMFNGVSRKIPSVIPCGQSQPDTFVFPDDNAVSKDVLKSARAERASFSRYLASSPYMRSCDAKTLSGVNGSICLWPSETAVTHRELVGSGPINTTTLLTVSPGGKYLAVVQLSPFVLDEEEHTPTSVKTDGQLRVQTEKPVHIALVNVYRMKDVDQLSSVEVQPFKTAKVPRDKVIHGVEKCMKRSGTGMMAGWVARDILFVAEAGKEDNEFCVINGLDLLEVSRGEASFVCHSDALSSPPGISLPRDLIKLDGGVLVLNHKNLIKMKR